MAESKHPNPFRLPTPSFGETTKKSIDSFTKLRNPHFSTPSGMLLPREKQPPPMYGPRGSTVPPWLVVSKGHQHHQPHGPGKGQSSYQQPRFRGPPRGGHHHHSGFDKDVIPELLEVDWNLWCEGCDVNCKTEEELRRHLSQHRACEVEGCKYVGHPRVMKRHWRLAHDEEKLKERALMESKEGPEDVEKWRKERRMRYPSKANVLRRMQEQEERFKRGERIEEDKSRFPNKKQWEPSQRKDNVKDSRSTRRKRRGHKKVEEIAETVGSESDSDDDVKTRIKFKGTAELKDYKEKQKNSLSLLCAYGSDSDESSEEESAEESTVVVENSDSASQELETTVSTETFASTESHLSEGEIVDSDSENELAEEKEHVPEQSTIGAVKDNVGEINPENDEAETKKRHRTHRKRRADGSEGGPSDQSKTPRIDKPLLDYSKLCHARKNTLLEKLLEPEIRHERNVLLQCVRFVVQNNFFGIGQQKASAADDQLDNQD
nr:nuclear fragile X mental retardation-interacting protein 1 [Aedes albopictus]